jgi:hypothetical protein
MSTRYEELTTPEAVLTAFEAGRHVEYTAFKKDDIDMPASNRPNSGGWVTAIQLSVEEIVDELRKGRYRALIEDPDLLGVKRPEVGVNEAAPSDVEALAEWLAREMPAGTVIGDPKWWADRIARRLRPQVDEAFERIAKSWDDCFYDDDLSGTSIGDRLRSDWLHLTAALNPEGPTHE